MSFVEYVKSNDLCTGCGICQSITSKKIKINYDSHGFLRPFQYSSIDKNEESILYETCPGIHIEHKKIDFNYNTIWGPINKIYVGYATDPEVRFKGSSGGAISAILLFLLESKKIDYILQTTSSHTEPLLNINKVSKTKFDILSCTGSRYSPSSPLVDINNYLFSPGTFAFVGKPCDVAALRNYANIDTRVNENIRYMISFMCAGIPSLYATHKILDEFGVKKEEVETFRYRGDGWPGLTTAITKSGVKHQMEYSRSWGEILGKQLQFRCKICPDGIGEFADVVCGDAWYLKGNQPDFSEREGRSIIITRTNSGEKLVSQCIDSGYLKLENFNIGDLKYIQPFHKYRKTSIVPRLFAMKILFKRTPRYKNLRLFKAFLKGNMLNHIKNILGTIKRITLCRHKKC